MTILHIDSSITGEGSVSREISQQIADRLAGESGRAVVRRDLAAEPLAHLTLEAFADTSVLDEFLGAHTVVIGAPMYNFTIPTQLKAWIDRVLVAGKTFKYGENGAEGLAGDKRVIVALARGGFYGADTPQAAFEHTENYLRTAFGFIGISPEFVTAEGIAVSPEHKHAALTQARGEALALAA